MTGKGHLYRAPGRKVWMLAYYGPRPDGGWGLIRESAKTENEAVAEKLLAKRLRHVANYREGVSEFEGPATRRVTLADLLDDLEALYRLKGIKGFDRVWYRIRKGSPLREHFGPMRARELTAAKVALYVLERQRAGLANATINREVELLRRAFRIAARSRKVLRVPDFPEKLPERNVRQGFPSKAQLARVVPLLPPAEADMAFFAFWTGWREGELLGLRWEWVDLKSREIRLPDSKNGQGRVLPLDGDLLALVERRRKAGSFETAGGVGLSDFVFHRNGKAIPRVTFGKTWRKACRAAELPHLLFHDLRRAAARNLTAAGVTEQVAMKITGHKTTSMFRRYNIVTTEDVRQALRLGSERAAEETDSNVIDLNQRQRS